MLRRRFIQSLLALAGFAPGAGGAAPVFTMRHTVLLQTSPVAGFQYHSGETVWPTLRIGDTLELVREPHNRFDSKAVRVDWNKYKLGYVPQTENHAIAQLLDRGKTLAARIIDLRHSTDPWRRVQFEVLLEA